MGERERNWIRKRAPSFLSPSYLSILSFWKECLWKYGREKNKMPNWVLATCHHLNHHRQPSQTQITLFTHVEGSKKKIKEEVNEWRQWWWHHKTWFLETDWWWRKFHFKWKAAEKFLYILISSWKNANNSKAKSL